MPLQLPMQSRGCPALRIQAQQCVYIVCCVAEGGPDPVQCQQQPDYWHHGHSKHQQLGQAASTLGSNHAGAVCPQCCQFTRCNRSRSSSSTSHQQCGHACVCVWLLTGGLSLRLMSLYQCTVLSLLDPACTHAVCAHRSELHQQAASSTHTAVRCVHPHREAHPQRP